MLLVAIHVDLFEQEGHTIDLPDSNTDRYFGKPQVLHGNRPKRIRNSSMEDYYLDEPEPMFLAVMQRAKIGTYSPSSSDHESRRDPTALRADDAQPTRESAQP